MSRPRRIDQTLVAQAQKVVAAATDLHQLRAAQAILLPAVLGASLEKTASLLAPVYELFLACFGVSC
jgi:hypothetical protein